MQQQTDQGREAAVREANVREAALPEAAVPGAAVRDAAGAELVVTSGSRSPEVVEGVLEDAVGRGAEAWVARGGRRRLRRWPGAAGSAVLGAVAAVAVTVLVRRLATHDAPGAQDPEQVQAVVDLAPTTPSTSVPPGAAVDEDGEAVQPL